MLMSLQLPNLLHRLTIQWIESSFIDGRKAPAASQLGRLESAIKLLVIDFIALKPRQCDPFAD